MSEWTHEMVGEYMEPGGKLEPRRQEHQKSSEPWTCNLPDDNPDKGPQVLVSTVRGDSTIKVSDGGQCGD